MADGLPVATAVMAELVEVGGGRVDHVAVTGIRENAYRSVIRVQADGRSAQVDARVSDTLNLAVRVGVPILLDDQVMREVACPVDQLPEHLEVLHRAEGDAPVEPTEWRPLSPDLISELKQPAAA